jgi:hypothetical protein
MAIDGAMHALRERALVHRAAALQQLLGFVGVCALAGRRLLQRLVRGLLLLHRAEAEREVVERGAAELGAGLGVLGDAAQQVCRAGQVVAHAAEELGLLELLRELGRARIARLTLLHGERVVLRLLRVSPLDFDDALHRGLADRIAHSGHAEGQSHERAGERKSGPEFRFHVVSLEVPACAPWDDMSGCRLSGVLRNDVKIVSRGARMAPELAWPGS